jgi:hypothetical protein
MASRLRDYYIDGFTLRFKSPTRAGVQPTVLLAPPGT